MSKITLSYLVQVEVENPKIQTFGHVNVLDIGEGIQSGIDKAMDEGLLTGAVNEDIIVSSVVTRHLEQDPLTDKEAQSVVAGPALDKPGSLGSFDREGEFYRGEGLLEDAIESMTMGLAWHFDEEVDRELILTQLRQIQAAINTGKIDLLREAEPHIPC